MEPRKKPTRVWVLEGVILLLVLLQLLLLGLWAWRHPEVLALPRKQWGPHLPMTPFVMGGVAGLLWVLRRRLWA